MSISELDNHALETGDANLSVDADIEPDRVDEPFAPNDPDADTA